MPEEDKPKTLARKILTVIITVIVTLFVLFFILLSWILIKNPMNVRGLILYKLGWVDEPVQLFEPEESEVLEQNNTSSESTPLTNGPAPKPLPMTPAQRQAVEDFGIDPDSIIITPAMEDCFVEKLGQERVNEIKQGDSPKAMDLIKANSCL